MKRLGIDIGSTTIKCVVLNEENNIEYRIYKRHMSRIAQVTKEILSDVLSKFPGAVMAVSISGSAGIGLAEHLKIPFIQEVFATKTSVAERNPATDVVVELGGEDAKILFLTNGFEARMNGSCAGGTGAFIDQMATLINLTPDELNELAAQSNTVYTIASRCGVFAKMDIQPLLNQGASIANVAASIMYAVVNQTIGGLAQGREITGNVLYLGGPLTFLTNLRECFNKALGISGVCPEDSLYYVALGAALLCENKETDLIKLEEEIAAYAGKDTYMSCKPLFRSEEEYSAFRSRHEKNNGNISYINSASGRMYLGVDAGSTTIKAVVCDRDGNILDQMYQKNYGNPVTIIEKYLKELYVRYPGIEFAGSAVTGYGEDIIKNAFGADIGVVETIAHYTAAKRFNPNVDFIIDIGGQDIKCFKIRNNAIDNIFLNEACSSGCGSFLQTFAEALHYDVKDFVLLGIYADKPVDLGSRCTVFMNSSVKQAQKDGASIENISAGLSISVVKNALYKVIRCSSAKELGSNIVVQGGTFINDVILRAFEQEIEHKVTRPPISGLMGAYGAALYAIEKKSADGVSSLIGKAELEAFTHTEKMSSCQGCSNHCQLTINTFGKNRKYIAGNRCEVPLKNKRQKEHLNMFAYKTALLSEYRQNVREEGKLTLGIPMALNIYEMLPFWHRLLTELGFNVVVSEPSTRKTFLKGQHTIPSDTICFPAKLVHGHVEELVESKIDALFYPCMTYNIEENKGDNHYNCPVVAYYPETVDKNANSVHQVMYIHDFIGIHEQKTFPKKFADILNTRLKGKLQKFVRAKDVARALKLAFGEYDKYLTAISQESERYIEIGKREHRPIIVIAGRPYHLDPEVNHGIDKMICELGAIVVTEDSVYDKTEKFRTTVLNQWTYHSRLYLAAKYVAENSADASINLVQLVSFGCGVDAITTDEVRAVLENAGKIYTQLKIDEVTNIGAAKIRIRSLFAAAGIEE